MMKYFFYPYYVTCYLLIISSLLIILFKNFKLSAFATGIFALICSITAIVFLPYSSTGYKSIIHIIFLFFPVLSFFIHYHFFEVNNNYGGSHAVSVVYLIIIMIFSSLFLLHDLATYGGTVLCWEYTVIKDFGHAFLNKTGMVNYMMNCFLWDDGLVSSGAHSFLYGSFTYALFHLKGFSPWTLRILSVIFTLLSTFLFYILGRRFYGPSIGMLASLLFILNTGVVFYGRYGTSLSATITATLLAILVTWTLVESKNITWWKVLICVLILYIATLHYAPARIFVILLLCQILFFTFLNISRRKIIAIIIISSVFFICFIERAFNRDLCFFNARGEQYVNFCKDSYYIRGYLGKDICPDKMTVYNKIELLYSVLKKNITGYVHIFSPIIPIRPAGIDNTDILDSDPPVLPLYYLPFFPFLIFGLCHSIRRIKDWKHAVPLGWFLIITCLLLLTNRVDSHRMFILTIPVTLFISFGLWEFWQILKKLEIPVIYIHVFSILLMVSVFYHNMDNLFYKNQNRLFTLQQHFILDDLNFIPSSVTIASLVDVRILGSVNLLMLEKARLYKGFTGNILEDRLRLGICDDHKEIDKCFVSELEVLLERTALVLLPAGRYQNISCELKKRGYNVVLKEHSCISLFIITRQEVP